MKKWFYPLILFLFLLILGICFWSGKKGKRKAEPERTKASSADIPAEKSGREEIPPDTSGKVGLGDELIYGGIGCTITSVSVTDADNDFAVYFPEYAAKADWRYGCISTLDLARMNVKSGQGDMEFSCRPVYKVIMHIRFHNYKDEPAHSLFALTDQVFYGIFLQDTLVAGRFEFTCQYDSGHDASLDNSRISDFLIDPHGDREADFIFHAYPARENETEPEKDGDRLLAFDGRGDLYLVPSDVFREWEGGQDVPCIFVQEEAVRRVFYHGGGEKKQKLRVMTYQAYCAEQKEQEK